MDSFLSANEIDNSSALSQEDSKALHSGMNVPGYLAVAEVVGVVFR